LIDCEKFNKQLSVLTCFIHVCVHSAIIIIHSFFKLECRWLKAALVL
jgi:hypothetical protein